MNFSEQLILLRKQKGLSQEQLGGVVGVTRQTVSKWELGDTTPEMDKLIQLSEYFDITVDQLVGHVKIVNTDQHNQSSEEIRIYRWHYEYKSQKTLGGVPLIHVNVGQGLYKAKGIIAVGTVAKGLISVGVLSAGVLSLGVLTLGAFSLGALSAGLLLAFGAVSLGTISFGGLSIGIFAVGGCAAGIYSLGGCAIASRIAAGGFAHAPVAIGDKAGGEIVFDVHGPIAVDAIKNAILGKFPRTWKVIVELFNAFQG